MHRSNSYLSFLHQHVFTLVAFMIMSSKIARSKTQSSYNQIESDVFVDQTLKYLCELFSSSTCIENPPYCKKHDFSQKGRNGICSTFFLMAPCLPCTILTCNMVHSYLNFMLTFFSKISYTNFSSIFFCSLTLSSSCLCSFSSVSSLAPAASFRFCSSSSFLCSCLALLCATCVSSDEINC